MEGENILEFDEAIEQRRSIRCYTEDPVPKELIKELIEAARKAPSATNRQPWRFLVVQDEDMKNRLQEGIAQSFVVRAPTIIVCCLDRHTFTRQLIEKRVEELIDANVMSREVANMLYQRKLPQTVEETGIPVSAYLDLGIAVEQIVLKATSMGLGSCWVRMFDQERVGEILSLPVAITPVVLLPVGYPAEDPSMRPRMSLDEILLDFI